MLVLSLDTTSEWGGAAVFDEERLLAAALNEGATNRFSVSLFEMAEHALKTAGIAMRDIGLFAAANGPGSFTGIRVGLAAVQGWSAAFGKPARGVSVLEAMVEEAQPAARWAFPLLDARRNEFYLGRFARVDSSAQPQATGFAEAGEGWVIGLEAAERFLADFLQNEANGANLCFIAREQDARSQTLRNRLEKFAEWVSVPGTLLPAIARIALKRQRNAAPGAPLDLDACYIRRPDAEILWRG